MTKEMTDYFYKVIHSNRHPTISFKNENFVSFSFEEIKCGYYIVKENDKICSLLNSSEFIILFDCLSCNDKKEKEFPLIFNISCVLSYKTLKTMFEYGTKNDYKEELAGVFYILVDLEFSRDKNDKVSVSFKFDKDNDLRFSRAFIQPTCDVRMPVVTSKDKIDEFLKNTTEKRVKIVKWEDYIDYCNDLFNNTADLSLEYEENCYLFRYNYIDSTMHIEELYKDLLASNKSHILYDRFMENKPRSNLTLISNNNVADMCKHSGQMNGKYPLAESQRQAVHHFKVTAEGDMLAVSGPPGTGKTTLLQSVVADMVVDSALNETAPPIIVATSSNNQAVTNIIDSFSNIEKIGISNLEERWVYGVESFATYMPSSSKKMMLKKKVINILQ